MPVRGCAYGLAHLANSHAPHHPFLLPGTPPASQCHTLQTKHTTTLTITHNLQQHSVPHSSTTLRTHWAERLFQTRLWKPESQGRRLGAWQWRSGARAKSRR
eukprot:540496-Rhodomonas_salina.1